VAPPESPGAIHRPHILRWWKEALITLTFYVIYSFSRNLFGSAHVAKGALPLKAFNNAIRVINLERTLGLFHEAQLQKWFAGDAAFFQFWNTFYGTGHFFVTIGVFIWVFVGDRRNFTHARNALAFTTAIAIAGFSLFPLMPPRLLENTGRYGGAVIAAEQHRPAYGFVDTIEVYGGPWSFDSGAGAKVSNQYAAMPSLHIAWATWCCIVVWRIVKRKWVRGLLLLYPLATLFCIVVTANHYFADAIGGLVLLAVGWFAGREFDVWNDRRLARKYG
jgi:PAP2 superfamily